MRSRGRELAGWCAGGIAATPRGATWIFRGQTNIDGRRRDREGRELTGCLRPKQKGSASRRNFEAQAVSSHAGLVGRRPRARGRARRRRLREPLARRAGHIRRKGPRGLQGVAARDGQEEEDGGSGARARRARGRRRGARFCRRGRGKTRGPALAPRAARLRRGRRAARPRPARGTKVRGAFFKIHRTVSGAERGDAAGARRGNSVETSRGDAAGAAWIVRGDDERTRACSRGEVDG